MKLTPREIRVAVLLKAGNDRKTIAAEMNIKSGSVDFHLINIRAKLRAVSTLQAACKLWENNLP